jgi:hypothetical protein
MGRTFSRHKEADKCLQNSSPRIRWEEISDVERVTIQSSILCDNSNQIIPDISKDPIEEQVFSKRQFYKTTRRLFSEVEMTDSVGEVVLKLFSLKFCMRMLTD